MQKTKKPKNTPKPGPDQHQCYNVTRRYRDGWTHSTTTQEHDWKNLERGNPTRQMTRFLQQINGKEKPGEGLL